MEQGIRKKNFSFFEQEILHFYCLQGRKNLPWRKEDISPYEVWVSEIMLQQTQVSRVIEYYNRFIKKFPDIFSLAHASWEEFLPYYRGLGYYRRGENMLKTARIIVEEHNGVFPKTEKSLLKLPGIGKYTTAAILSFGYNEKILSFDTNLQKVIGRFFYGTKDAKINTTIFMECLTSGTRQFNGAIMDFANIICLKNPKCDQCTLSKNCIYFKQKGKREVQKEKKRTLFPSQKATAYIFLHKDHKVYYSSQKDTYTPFILKAPYNTREKIKQYFLEHYNIELSVRPPHKKRYLKKKPIIYIFAQILLGENGFEGYSKKDYSKYKKESLPE